VSTARPDRVLVICTGNAARSVMAGFMLEHLAERRAGRGGNGLRIATAGTHSVDGQPMSFRTRNALASIDELGELAVSRHRSRQMGDVDVEHSDLVVAMEADHIRYVRRNHPDAAGRTATIRRLARDLAPPPASLAERVAALELAATPIDKAEDVLDPAGGDEATYIACAAELWGLCGDLIDRL
jgi:protein-tyrosine phosphatase